MLSLIHTFSLAIGIIGGIFGIIGVISAIYFAYQSHKLNQELAKQTAVATLDLKINNLPPYKSENDFTEITIKNVGQRVSGSKLKVVAVCSWADEIQYQLRFPSPNWVLQPNEEYRWKVRFGYSGQLEGNKISISATDSSGHAWEMTERIV